MNFAHPTGRRHRIPVGYRDGTSIRVPANGEATVRGTSRSVEGVFGRRQWPSHIN